MVPRDTISLRKILFDSSIAFNCFSACIYNKVLGGSQKATQKLHKASKNQMAQPESFRASKTPNACRQLASAGLATRKRFQISVERRSKINSKRRSNRRVEIKFKHISKLIPAINYNNKHLGFFPNMFRTRPLIEPSTSNH